MAWLTSCIDGSNLVCMWISEAHAGCRTQVTPRERPDMYAVQMQGR